MEKIIAGFVLLLMVPGGVNANPVVYTPLGSDNLGVVAVAAAVKINLKNWKVTHKLESGSAPEHMIVSKDEKTIYVTNPRTGKIAAVAVDSGKTIKRYSIGKAVHGLDMGDDGKTFFASSKKDNKLVTVDTETDVQRELALSPAPYHLNTITDTGKVYVSSRKKPAIWVADQKTINQIWRNQVASWRGASDGDR